jgi:hypothetical protein
MEYVENYFQSGVDNPTQRIRGTSLPPLYFQHAGTPPPFSPSLLQPSQLTTPVMTTGHSLTIIGFEKLKNGAKNLIVFDPSFHDSSSIVRLVGQTFVHPLPDLALKMYRRGNKYLKMYSEFEVLRLVT